MRHNIFISLCILAFLLDVLFSLKSVQAEEPKYSIKVDALKGADISGGGHAFESPAGSGEIVLLDVLERGEEFSPTELPVFQSIIKPYIEKLKKKNPALANFYEWVLTNGGPQWTFVDVELAPTPLTGFSPIALDTLYFKNKEGDGKYYEAGKTDITSNRTLISKKVWEKLKDPSKAFLILHEATWWAELSPQSYELMFPSKSRVREYEHFV